MFLPSSPEKEYAEFLDQFCVPSDYDYVLLSSGHTALDSSPDYLSLYLSLFSVGNFRLPLNKFFLDGLWWRVDLTFVQVFVYPGVCRGLVDFLEASREPFNESLRARLSRYPIEPNVFSEVILYLADLALSWEGSPLHPANFIDGQEMTQQDFLHYPGNHHVTITADPVSAPLPVGSPDVLVANTSSEDANILGVKGTSVAAWSAPRGIMDAPTFVGSSFKGKKIIGSSVGGLKKRRFKDLDGVASSPVFVRRRVRRLDGLSLPELANFHDVFALKFLMFNTMLNKEVHSLSVEASRIRDENFRLRGKNLKSTATIARLEAELLGVGELSPLVESSKKILVADVEALRGRCRKFEEKEAIMLATEATFEEVASMDLGFQLENIKDYDPNAMEAYDKAVDDFYRVEFPYLDLLAYHLRRSLGFLKSLEPPSLPLHKSLGAGPSSSSFI
ncbi:hypothetical protein Tco_0720485 [Tanacetum coccineum]